MHTSRPALALPTHDEMLKVLEVDGKIDPFVKEIIGDFKLDQQQEKEYIPKIEASLKDMEAIASILEGGAAPKVDFFLFFFFFFLFLFFFFFFQSFFHFSLSIPFSCFSFSSFSFFRFLVFFVFSFSRFPVFSFSVFVSSFVFLLMSFLVFSFP